MPTITVDLSDLNRLLGERHSLRELRVPLRNLGIEVEGITSEGLKLEVHHNRPDLYGVEGVARALKGYLGMETGLPNYELKDPSLKLKVDSSLDNLRPVAVMGRIENADFDDVSLKAIMDLQEKLHDILGRDREKISIGAYDLEKIEPPIRYTTVEPDDEGFIPLEFEEKMTPQEILEKHPKGQKFRHLIDHSDRYPILVGSNGTVLSMPPIINSENCRLTPEARDIGVDVTGINEDVARQALEIILGAAAERGCEISAVKVEYSDREYVTPKFESEKMSFDIDEANEKLGLNLEPDGASNIMEKMRYDVEGVEDRDVSIRLPFYRFDIMHEVDLFEDLAIGYGYDELEPTLPSIEVSGEPHSVKENSKIVRRVLTGLGFMEVMPYMLSSPELNFDSMRSEGEAVTISNPVSEEHSILRTWLLPGLMNVLRENRRHELPQKVFEVDEVVLIDEDEETGARNEVRVGGVAVGKDIDFTYGRAVAEALLREFNLDWTVERFEHSSLLQERSAEFLVDGEHVGFVGEIHPEVILNFELENPVVGFELKLPK